MNKATLQFLLASIGILLFLSCKKEEEAPIPSFKLQKVRSSMAIPQNATYYPRVLGDRVWCAGNENMISISCLDASVQSISWPNNIRINNEDQHYITFTGSDIKNLYYFDYLQQIWAVPFTAPAGQYLDQYEETEVFGDLLPFIVKDSTSKRQEVYSFDFSTKQTTFLSDLSDLVAAEKWRLRTQPKVTTLSQNGKNEVLLSILADSSDTKNVYVVTYNLSTKKWQSKLNLGQLVYNDIKVVGNRILAIHLGYLSDAGSLINPETGQLIWYNSSAIFSIFNEHLFASVPLLGSVYLPLNSDDRGFNFPLGVSVSSITSEKNESFCTIGNEKIGDKYYLNQIVLVNIKNGKEVYRSPLPDKNILVGPVLAYPDSSFLIVMDDEQKFNFLKVE